MIAMASSSSSSSPANSGRNFRLYFAEIIIKQMVISVMRVSRCRPLSLWHWIVDSFNRFREIDVPLIVGVCVCVQYFDISFDFS